MARQLRWTKDIPIDSLYEAMLFVKVVSLDSMSKDQLMLVQNA